MTEEPTTVYQYFAGNGALIYVGITNRGTRRLHEHADSKPWWHLATGCTLEHYANRDEALERESYLIRTHRPPYNQQHNPDRGKPVAERSGRLNLARNQLKGTLKERRTAWYAAEKWERQTLACVRCGLRPGITGPECLTCRQAKVFKRDPAQTARSSLQHLLEVEASRPLLASEKRVLSKLYAEAQLADLPRSHAETDAPVPHI